MCSNENSFNKFLLRWIPVSVIQLFLSEWSNCAERNTNLSFSTDPILDQCLLFCCLAPGKILAIGAVFRRSSTYWSAVFRPYLIHRKLLSCLCCWWRNSQRKSSGITFAVCFLWIFLAWVSRFVLCLIFLDNRNLYFFVLSLKKAFWGQLNQNFFLPQLHAAPESLILFSSHRFRSFRFLFFSSNILVPASKHFPCHHNICCRSPVYFSVILLPLCWMIS